MAGTSGASDSGHPNYGDGYLPMAYVKSLSPRRKINVTTTERYWVDCTNNYLICNR
jgi:hypothetical protein